MQRRSWPRLLALDIERLPPEQRPAALERAPAELRDWVRFYLTESFPRLRGFAERAARYRAASDTGEPVHAD